MSSGRRNSQVDIFSLVPTGTKGRLQQVPSPSGIFGEDEESIGEKYWNEGLGAGPGGRLARSLLNIGAPDSELFSRDRTRQPVRVLESKAPDLKTGLPAAGHADTDPLVIDGIEPRGMVVALLLNDVSAVDRRDLAPVRDHRWTFKGAVELAAYGKAFLCFVLCLLDLQRNVQLRIEGGAMDPKLLNGCKMFVRAQCRSGYTHEMFQFFTHFLCNTILFVEWAEYLKTTFADSRAKSPSFLEPRLEQVWSRFHRFLLVLENIFVVLDKSFGSENRFPGVHGIIKTHLKKRCFGKDVLGKNDPLGGTHDGDYKCIKEVQVWLYG